MNNDTRGNGNSREISYLKNLVNFNLSTSGLFFLGSPSLKLENPNFDTLVKNLSSLTQLYLDGVNISTSENEWCQALSSSLPNLQELSMRNYFLYGPFHPSLGNLQSLSVLHLENNNFSDSVSKFLGNFTNLTVLDISSYGLKGIFPKEVSQVSSREILDLSLNKQLQGYLPNRFQNASLRTLVLRNTSFSSKIPESIHALENLSRIDIAYCTFIGSILSLMEYLTELVYLDFSFNDFIGQIPSFVQPRKLMYIDFSHNKLSGEIISSHWESFVNLVHVDLRYNMLNRSIPQSLFTIPLLQKILLSFNSFSSLLPGFSEASSFALNTLDLSSNKLEGPIPTSVFNLIRLHVFSLLSNKFNGIVKLEWIRELSNLTTLDLSFNILTVDTSNSNTASPSFS